MAMMTLGSCANSAIFCAASRRGASAAFGSRESGFPALPSAVVKSVSPRLERMAVAMSEEDAWFRSAKPGRDVSAF
eukprot:12463349-Alexandrium_andersonii.AAC.1